jgi:hypothetical protein
VGHLQKTYDLDDQVSFHEFERIYSLIFAALGFMLVFRLGRAAVRFWAGAYTRSQFRST